MIVAVAVLVVAGGVVLWLRRRYVYATVTSESMAPTLQVGDRVLVRRTPARQVRTGDVVVIARPPAAAPATGWVVKRVVAGPGDPVPRDGFPALRDAGHDLVPPGCLVVLGDLGERSQDSKQLGYFRAADLLGVVPRRLVTHRPASRSR